MPNCCLSTKQGYRYGYYDFKSAKVYMSQKRVDETTESGAVISNTIDYFYENSNYLQLTKTKQTNSDGLVKETTYKYCYDVSSAVSDSMKIRNIINQPLFITTKVNNSQAEVLEVQFDLFNSNKIPEPKTVRKQAGSSSPYTTISYFNYDSYGNPLYLSKDGANQTCYLWSYAGRYLIAEIKNATFAEVETAVKRYSR